MFSLHGCLILNKGAKPITSRDLYSKSICIRSLLVDAYSSGSSHTSSSFKLLRI